MYDDNGFLSIPETADDDDDDDDEDEDDDDGGGDDDDDEAPDEGRVYTLSFEVVSVVTSCCEVSLVFICWSGSSIDACMP